MATLVNKMNREVKVIIPNMREFRVFYSDNEGSTMFFKRDWEEEKTTKQEEQVWSEEDEGELQNAIDALEFLGKKGIYKSESGYNAALQAAFWLKNIPERFNLQPKQAEFNDNDDQLIGFIFDLLNDLVWRKDWAMSKEECLERLKSLRPQPHWKPSEEQMKALCSKLPVVKGRGDKVQDILETLYYDLKKRGVKEEPEYYQHFDPDC